MRISQLHWVALATTNRVGGKTITALRQHFGSLEAVFQASHDDLMAVPGVGQVTASAIKAIDLEAVQRACRRFADQGVRFVIWGDEAEYPRNLLFCDDPPPVLFVRGTTILPTDRRAVAVVGTRTPTPESAALAHQIGAELASRGWTIVSGLALGIDAAAHQGALSVGGRTFAVLGCGVLRLYPPDNLPLARDILNAGAILSELHPEAGVNAQNLIARNRITSGLSRAVIVVQSGEDSGSMNTARRARQQNRLVFAVTGGDQGCETLLSQGAESLTPGAIDWDALSDRLDQVVISAVPDTGQISY